MASMEEREYPDGRDEPADSTYNPDTRPPVSGQVLCEDPQTKRGRTKGEGSEECNSWYEKTALRFYPREIIESFANFAHGD